MPLEAQTAPETGPLSLDQAAGLLGPDIEREDDAPAAEQVPEPQPEPENPEPAQEGEGAEEPHEANQGEEETEVEPEPEGPEIEPPLFWDGARKDEFKKLPREIQQYVAEQADTANKFVSKQVQEAAEARKGAEQAVQAFTQKAEHIDRLIHESEAVIHADGWAELMALTPAQWSTLLRQDPDTYRPAKEQVDLRKAELQRLYGAKQEADQAREAQNFAAYVASQAEELGRLAPQLATDGTKKSDIARYLMDQGIAPNELRGISARQLILAEKAMKWDQAQKAQANRKPQPKPAPAVAQPKPVRPAASAAASPRQRAAKEVETRFNKDRSVDAAVALLNSRG